MFLDAATRIANAQAFTASAVSASSYDLGAGTIPPDIGAGEGLAVGIAIGVSADHTTGDETYEWDLIQATDQALTAGVDALLQMVVLFSALTAGQVKKLPIPAGVITKRFLGIKYIGGGTTPTVTATAWIGPSTMITALPNISYPKGYSIS